MSDSCWSDEEKMALNLHAKAEMRQYLCSLSWEEKVASIELMNAAGKLVREAMRSALDAETASVKGVSLTACDVEPSA